MGDQVPFGNDHQLHYGALIYQFTVARKTLFIHRAFGLSLASPVDLAELPTLTLEAESHAVDVTLMCGPLEHLAPEFAAADGPCVSLRPGWFACDIPGVARYLVERGERITVDPAPGASWTDIRIWLLGSAMGALLHQRRTFPLHASAVEIDGGAIAICGPSGAGKSTTAEALVRRGHRLITDDVLAIAPAPVTMAFRGTQRMKLCADAMHALAIDPVAYPRDTTTAAKYHVTHARDQGAADAVPLAAIVQMEFAADGTIGMVRCRGVEALSLLVANTYRQGFAAPLGVTQGWLDQLQQLARTVPCHRVIRPRDFGQLPMLCRELEEMVEHSR